MIGKELIGMEGARAIKRKEGRKRDRRKGEEGFRSADGIEFHKDSVVWIV